MAFNFLKNFRWRRMADRNGPRSLIVADIGDTEIRVIVMERKGDSHTFSYPIIIPHNDVSSVFKNPDFLSELQKLASVTPYISIVIGGGTTMIRLMVLSGAPGAEAKIAQRVRQTLGVNEDYDVVHQIVERTDDQHTVLTTAMPSKIAEDLDQALAESGFSPVSLVHTGTVVANLSLFGQEIFDSQGNTAILHIDIDSSILSVRVNKKNALIRQLKQGLRPVYQSISESYGLDEDMAVKLFNSGSFDISGQTGRGMADWFHQVEMSLDFVARRMGGRVDRVYLSGSSPGINVLCESFAAALGRPVEIIPELPYFSRQSLVDRSEDGPATLAPYLIAATEGARILHPDGGHK